MSIQDLIAANQEASRLGDLISSVSRPGDFYASGRLQLPMPKIDVDGVGTIAMPVQKAMAEAIIDSAKRSPYGRGEQTIYDASVRNSWQIDAEQVRIGGAAWNKTLKKVLNRVSEDLGCPKTALTAELYKLLVYEPGGFFAPHRDTEKSNGMVATMVLALPGPGCGGELVIRHRDRESVIDMRTEDPSELVYAAFYADCLHEVRPIASGYRVCLVFNLSKKPASRVSAAAPDFESLVDPIASELRAVFSAEFGPDKLAYLLEHDYSEAGISFDTLKNVDAARARILVSAAERAECAIHAAILHVSESAPAEYFGYSYEVEDVDESMYELYDEFEGDCQFGGMIDPDGRRPILGDIPLAELEMIPSKVSENLKPDSVRLTEASGNEGATVDRQYFRGAMLLWPKSDTARVFAPAGASALDAFLRQERKRQRKGTIQFAPIDKLASDSALFWPSRVIDDYWSRYDPDWEAATGSFLALLIKLGLVETARQFVSDTALPNHTLSMNKSLARAVEAIGVDAVQSSVRQHVEGEFARKPAEVIDLVWRLSKRQSAKPGPKWVEALAELTRLLAVKLAAFDEEFQQIQAAKESWRRQKHPDPFSPKTVANYFEAVWRFNLEDRSKAATGYLLSSPAILSPWRDIPKVLERLNERCPEAASRSAAMEALWHAAAVALLKRSGDPLVPPADWITPASGLNCDCELCDGLRDFCADPEATVWEIATNQGNRKHIRYQCRNADISIEFETRRRGRPYTLVCTKTRAWYERRRTEYFKDVKFMKKLVTVAGNLPCPELTLSRVRRVISDSGEVS